ITTAVHDECVSRRRTDALSARDLLEFPSVHGVFNRHIRRSPVSWDIQQHPASEDAVGELINRPPAQLATLAGHARFLKPTTHRHDVCRVPPIPCVLPLPAVSDGV